MALLYSKTFNFSGPSFFMLLISHIHTVRSVELVANTYGFSERKSIELILWSCKFHVADTLPDEDMTNMHMTKAQAKIEFKTQSTLKSDLFASPVRTAGAGLTKTDAQATYGLRFGRSIYRWKAKEISFPTQLIPYQNTLGVDGNRRNNMTTRICLDAATPVFGPEGLVLPRVARPPPWPPP